MRELKRRGRDRERERGRERERERERERGRTDSQPTSFSGQTHCLDSFGLVPLSSFIFLLQL
jgi:hypothetical protein